MTTAEAIKNTAQDAAHAMHLAESLSNAHAVQDWENERTIFTFVDNSVLVVSGPEVTVDTGV